MTQSEAEKLIEEVAALINPGVFSSDANALLDAWARKPHDRDAARRADVRYGLGLGISRAKAREKALAVTALIVGRCAGTAAGWRNPQAVKLAAGEMTAQELRTALAVAGGIEATIRTLSPEAPQPEAKEARE